MNPKWLISNFHSSLPTHHSSLTPYINLFSPFKPTPQTSVTWFITPHTLHLTLYPSHITPHSSNHSSLYTGHLTPHNSLIYSHTSHLHTPHPLFLTLTLNILFLTLTLNILFLILPLNITPDISHLFRCVHWFHCIALPAA